jgi:hypothetical protein
MVRSNGSEYFILFFINIVIYLGVVYEYNGIFIIIIFDTPPSAQSLTHVVSALLLPSPWP